FSTLNYWTLKCRNFFSTGNPTFLNSFYFSRTFFQCPNKPPIKFIAFEFLFFSVFFTIMRGVSSLRSNVLKRKPQRSHSLRLRIASPSSKGRESSTREFV